MRQNFSSTEYSYLEAQFCLDSYEGLSPVWSIHPEEITLIEMDTCNICEIRTTPQMSANVFSEFNLFLQGNGFLKTGLLLCIKTGGENSQQHFSVLSLEAIFDGAAICILRKKELIIENTPVGKSYSAEEEAFFSQFRTEGL